MDSGPTSSIRSADLLNVLFAPARWNKRIDEFVATYDPEIQQHLDRWNGGWNNWASHTDKLRLFASNRAPEVRGHFVGAFPEVTGIASVDLAIAGEGSVSFSTVKLAGDGDAMSGVWFTGVEIPVRAVPCDGGSFERWSGASTATAPEITVVLNQDTSLTAHFVGGDCGSTQVPIVLNEIHYHPSDAQPSGDWVELYNAGLSAVDMSNWKFADDADGLDSFTLPVGTVLAPGDYLVLAADSASLLAVFPDAHNVLGDFGGDAGFGLSNGGELLVLNNHLGDLIDQVEYDDAAPWPTEPDGDGPSLSLIDAQSNNELAGSWQARTPTPGRSNDSDPVEPQAQTIDFGPLAQRSTDSVPFEVTATASSGLPVTFEIVTGPASISSQTAGGATITLVGTVGTVVVRATQPGNVDWLAAAPVERAFAVIEPSDRRPAADRLLLLDRCPAVAVLERHRSIRRDRARFPEREVRRLHRSRSNGDARKQLSDRASSGLQLGALPEHLAGLHRLDSRRRFR